LTNTTDGVDYLSDVKLTAADGTTVTLTPDVIDQGAIAVTIPADVAPRAYNVQAVKGDVASNPVVISVLPAVSITEATGDETVTIKGTGFGGYQAGSGTSVTGTITVGRGKNKTTTTVEATILSWEETTIVAQFDSQPKDVTVTSVFGEAAAEVSKGGGSNGKGGGKPDKPGKPPKKK
jgi:hypothetical protein